MKPTTTTKQIKLSTLKPSPFQPRHFGKKPDADLEDLAESIRTKGLLSPILVRPKGKGHELVAGERRARACRIVGLKTIESIVRDLDDDQALESCLIENLQRQDLHFLEEADAFQKLLDSGRTVQQVADKVTRSIAFVSKRARLTTLAPAVLKAFEGDDFQNWGPAHLQIVAKLSPNVQTELFDPKKAHVDGSLTVAELESLLATRTQDLRGAPFDVADEDLVPKAGSCLTCPKRSDHLPGLFDEQETAPGNGGKIPLGAKCLDAHCWRSKSDALVVAKLAELRSDHGKTVRLVAGSGHGLGQSLIDQRWQYGFQGQPVIEIGQFTQLKKCKANTPGAVPAMIVAGAGLGESVFVVDRYTKAATKRSPKSMTDEQKRQYLRNRRLVRCHLIVFGKPPERSYDFQTGKPKPPKPGREALLKTKAKVPPIAAVLWWAYRLGTEHQADGTRPKFSAGKPFEVATRYFLERLVPRARTWSAPFGLDDAERKWTRLAEFLRAVGIKPQNVMKVAIAEIPEPKAWSAHKGKRTLTVATKKRNAKKRTAKKTAARRRK